MHPSSRISFFFFFNDTATTEIYTLSLHDALPILFVEAAIRRLYGFGTRSSDGEKTQVSGWGNVSLILTGQLDRKSTRLNSSHLVISYAVFCLKKKQTICNHPVVVRLLLSRSPAYR